MKLTYHDALQHKTCLSANGCSGAPSRLMVLPGKEGGAAADRSRDRA
jgi:hypothetical protein